MQLARLEQLDEHVTKLDDRIDARLEPYREQHTRLTAIPGVDRVVAATIVAEVGTDMRVFKSASHLAAWAGVCPGNNESAGTRKRSPARKGNVHLMTALVEAAHGASSTRGSYLRDKFHRLKARRGYQRASVAIAHKILIAVHVMLSTGAEYRDLGLAYLDSIDTQRVKGNLVRRLERLGYDVAITKRPPTSDSSPKGELLTCLSDEQRPAQPLTHAPHNEAATGDRPSAQEGNEQRPVDDRAQTHRRAVPSRAGYPDVTRRAG
jgi:hypothetical protein